MRTLGTVVAVTAACLLVVLFLLYRQNRQYAGLGWWVLGQGSMVMTFVISATAGADSWRPLVVVSTTGTVASLLCMYVGIVRFLGRPVPRVWPWVYLTGTAAGMTYFSLIAPQVGVRRGLLYLLLAGTQAMTVRALVVYRREYISASGWFMRAVFSIAAVYYAGLGLATWSRASNGQRLLDLDGASTLAWVGAISLMIMWTFGLSLLVSEHLRHDLAEDRANMRQVFLASPDATVISRLHDGLIRDVNDGFSRLFGYPRDEVVGRTAAEVGLWPDPASRQQVIDLVIAGPVEGVATRLLARDGRLLQVGMSARVLHLDGEPHLITVSRDITEQKRWEAELHRLALTDELTGIHNRRAFLAEAERQLQRCHSRGVPLALAVVDLDDFKALNDTHGHAVGDAAVRAFAASAGAVLRDGQCLGRLGGDEFGVLLPATALEDARALVEEIRSAVAGQGMCLDGRHVRLSFSAGVATHEGCTTVDEVFAKADAGLYRAKALGRNRVVAA